MNRFLAIALVWLVCACGRTALGQQAPPVPGPPTQPAASTPGTLTLPVGTVCSTVDGRPVCVMPPEPPAPPAPPKPQPLPPLPAPPPSCPSFYALGADYTLNGSPKWTGWAAIATLFPGVKCDPALNFQPRSISQYVARIVKVNGVDTIQTTTTTGVALPMQKLGPIQVYVLGTVGPNVSGSGSVSLGSSYGAVATVPLKWGILATPAIQWVNGSRSAWIGFGRAFGR